MFFKPRLLDLRRQRSQSRSGGFGAVCVHGGGAALFRPKSWIWGLWVLRPRQVAELECFVGTQGGSGRGAGLALPPAPPHKHLPSLNAQMTAGAHLTKRPPPRTQQPPHAPLPLEMSYCAQGSPPRPPRCSRAALSLHSERRGGGASTSLPVTPVTSCSQPSAEQGGKQIATPRLSLFLSALPSEASRSWSSRGEAPDSFHQAVRELVELRGLAPAWGKFKSTRRFLSFFFLSVSSPRPPPPEPCPASPPLPGLPLLAASGQQETGLRDPSKGQRGKIATINQCPSDTWRPLNVLAASPACQPQVPLAGFSVSLAPDEAPSSHLLKQHPADIYSGSRLERKKHTHRERERYCHQQILASEV